MQLPSDAQWIRDYAAHGSDPAFAGIVARHTDLVYSAALRQTGSPELAREIAQNVFTDLARKAPELAGRLAPEASLAGWLYRGTRFATLSRLRDERRRASHERQFMEHFHPAAGAAHSRAAECAAESAPDWQQIAPVLDEAMAELGDADREAVLLRYFQNQDFQAVARVLGVSEAAAQKRVSRAVERLRDLIAKRGVTTGTSGLVVLISANAVLTAPAGLNAAIAASALAGTTILTTAAAITAQTIAMTTLQKSLVAAALSCAVGMAIYQGLQASAAKNETAALRLQASLRPTTSSDLAQLAGLRASVETLRSENALLTAALAKAREQNTQLGMAHTDAERRAKQFKELADTAQRPAGTNQYPTARHFLADFGRTLAIPVKMEALLQADDSKLTPEQQAAKAAAQVTMFEKLAELAKASKLFEQELEAAGADRADMVAVLLYGSLDLNEQQFSQIYSLVQRYRTEAQRQNLLGKSPSSEAQHSLAKLNEQARAELQLTLSPEQNKWFQQLTVPLIGEELEGEGGKTSFQFGFGAKMK